MTTTGNGSTRLRGLVTAGHAPPSIAVTIMATMLAVRAGVPFSRVLLVALAVGAGQFSIGLLNDWWDAESDRAAERSDKPIVSGTVSRTAVGRAVVVSTVLCVVMSAWLGLAGVMNLIHVAAGWAYDLRAKTTRLSVVPYVIAFGTLPAVATLAAAPPHWPPVWMVVAGALLGAGGHFANALPDLESDARAGVHGLPQRLGARTSLLLSAACLGTGAMVAVVAASGVLSPSRGAGATGAALLAASGVLIVAALLVAVVITARRGRARLSFRLTIGLAIIVVAMLVVPT